MLKIIRKIQQTIETFVSKFSHKKLWYMSILGISAVVMISRRPDALARPQFFAEDGFLWYAQAYNNGMVAPFFEPVAGYFQTLARIGGLLSQAVPLQYAPLVMNGVALCIQLLPILLMLSHRCNNFITSSWAKVVLVVSYLLLFNSQETHLNLTNAQWYLAVSALLVILAAEPHKKAWSWFDTAVVLLSGMSGPFAILLYPVALILYLKEKTERLWWLTTIVSLSAAVQLVAVIFTGRSDSTFVATQKISEVIIGLWVIFHKQVVWGMMSGQVGYEWFTQLHPRAELFTQLISAAVLILLCFVFFKAQLRVKLTLVCAASIFLVSTVFPTILIPTGKTSWQVLENAYGIRYWLLPILAVLGALVWATRRSVTLLIRATAYSILIVMTLFWFKLYRYKQYYQFSPLEDFNFTQQVKSFTEQPSGTEVVIHHPPKPWSMRLVKK
jgi:hypothetical protein